MNNGHSLEDEREQMYSTNEQKTRETRKMGSFFYLLNEETT